YMDDLNIPIMAHRYVLRCPHTYVRIRSIDTSAAETTPGVFAVLTGADCAIDGLGPVSCDMVLERPDCWPYCHPLNDPLVRDKTRMVGDYVAFVAAETLKQAKDAVEAIKAAAASC
ncbi:MAG: xanthine dehydrogenase family protein molybdopterin-binding subunit, partial [Pseudomonadota bacterium]|nr:xanthine dehydrogenase family protein molybdopterin-binding subunit [Pseudomonadota bacterium]